MPDSSCPFDSLYEKGFVKLYEDSKNMRNEAHSSLLLDILQSRKYEGFSHLDRDRYSFLQVRCYTSQKEK